MRPFGRCSGSFDKLRMTQFRGRQFVRLNTSLVDVDPLAYLK